jgi:hypothetical protein
MGGRTFGSTLLAGVFLVAGLAGIAASWQVWPRSADTSPLAGLFALAWGSTYTVTAILTWRRSRFAGPSFLAAIALMLFPAAYLVPGGRIFLPSVVVLVVVAFLGYRYLHGVRGPATSRG